MTGMGFLKLPHTWRWTKQKWLFGDSWAWFETINSSIYIPRTWDPALERNRITVVTLRRPEPWFWVLIWPVPHARDDYCALLDGHVVVQHQQFRGVHAPWLPQVGRTSTNWRWNTEQSWESWEMFWCSWRQQMITDNQIISPKHVFSLSCTFRSFPPRAEIMPSLHLWNPAKSESRRCQTHLDAVVLRATRADRFWLLSFHLPICPGWIRLGRLKA